MHSNNITKTPIWQFKALIVWVKTILISELVEAGETVADFNCGGGLDAGKWDRSKIKRYYGFDSSDSNLKESEIKFKQKKTNIDLKFLKVELDNQDLNIVEQQQQHQQPLPIFDTVSCFDGMQFSFTDIGRAEQFIKNASSKLKVGGYFFGIIPDSSSIWYKCQSYKEKSNKDSNDKNPPFQYEYVHHTPKTPHFFYNLVEVVFETEIQSFFGCKYSICTKDSSPVTENLIHFPSFLNLCKKYNLILVEATNLQDFFDENRKNYEDKLKSSGVFNSSNKKIESHQSELLNLYTTFIFVKELPEPKIIKTTSQ